MYVIESVIYVRINAIFFFSLDALNDFYPANGETGPYKRRAINGQSVVIDYEINFN